MIYTDEEIIKMYKEGIKEGLLSVSAIARKNNIPASTFSYRINCLCMQNQIEDITKYADKKIIKIYKDGIKRGLNISEMAKENGMSISTLSQKIKRLCDENKLEKAKYTAYGNKVISVLRYARDNNLPYKEAATIFEMDYHRMMEMRDYLRENNKLPSDLAYSRDKRYSAKNKTKNEQNSEKVEDQNPEKVDVQDIEAEVKDNDKKSITLIINDIELTIPEDINDEILSKIIKCIKG